MKGKVKPLVVKAPRHRHIELFSGAFKPKRRPVREKYSRAREKEQAHRGA